MQVPFNDLKRVVGSNRHLFDSALSRVLDGGWFLLGPELRQFEEEFSSYCGVKECVGLASGTDALELALRAAGCGPGYEVVTVANAGMYATTACVLCGCRPVFVDVDPRTLQLDVRALEGLLSPRTKAIVVTHLYGKLADVEEVLKIARGRGITVIEDCAQAHGAQKGGRVAGSFGDLAAFSFYPTKNLGAFGDAGAVLTNRADYSERLRGLRQYGWKAKYQSVLPSSRNSRMDEIQAAVLRQRLPSLDGANARRREIVAAYRAAADGGTLRILHVPAPDYVAHLCVALHPEREVFRGRLAESGIETVVHYPIPDHLQPSLSGVSWRSGSLKVTESIARQVVSLPCFPEMTDMEVDHVCEAIKRAERA